MRVLKGGVRWDDGDRLDGRWRNALTVHARTNTSDGHLAGVGALLVVRYVLQEALRLHAQSRRALSERVVLRGGALGKEGMA